MPEKRSERRSIVLMFLLWLSIIGLAVSRPPALDHGGQIAETVASPPPAGLVSTFSKTPPPRPLTRKEQLAEITAANAIVQPLPNFRTVRIEKGALDRTSTVRGEHDFVISFPSRATGERLHTPAVYGGLLVSGGYASSKSVYAFNAHDGTPVWTVDLEDNGPSAMACDEGVCAFNTSSCSLYVVDVKTGTPLWGKYVSAVLPSAPTIANGRVFTSYPTYDAKTRSSMASVAAFDLRTGAVVWNRRLDADVTFAPSASSKDVFVSTQLGAVFRFAQQTGEQLSVKEGASYLHRALNLSDRTVIQIAGDVIARGPSGTELWRANVEATTPPIAAAGSIWVGTEKGTVVRLDRESGWVEKAFMLGSAVQAEPILQDGWIYAPTEDGLVAVDTKDPSITGWSQAGGNAQRWYAEKSSRQAAASESQ